MDTDAQPLAGDVTGGLDVRCATAGEGADAHGWSTATAATMPT
jgi:hypothetical protein